MESILTVNMPEIGEGVVEGEVVSWLKQEGDPVGQDEPVVVLLTDKATVELPSPRPGILVKQYYKAGETAFRDKPLYDLRVAGAKTGEVKKEDSPILATPAVRQRARELKIPLEKVRGSGKEGRITEEDLKGYQEGPRTNENGEKIPWIGIPGQMAKSMQLSHTEVPLFSYFEQADVSRLVQMRAKIAQQAAKEKIPLSYMPFLIRALSLALQKFPKVNGSYDKERRELILHPYHHMGIAFSTSTGLIVPVLKNVEKLSLEQIIRDYHLLKQRVSADKLTSSDMQGATISLSNFGAVGDGGLWATPLINLPQIAILAVAKIHKEPVVRGDEVVVREMLNLSWSFDHRVIDGALAAQFSHFFAHTLQNPINLVN